MFGTSSVRLVPALPCALRMEHRTISRLVRKHTAAFIATGLVILGNGAIWYFYFTIPGLTRGLHSNSQDTRCTAAKRLANMGRDARITLTRLESMLDDTECWQYGHDALPEWVDAVGGADAWFDVAKNGGHLARRNALRWLELAVREHPERSEELEPLFAAGLQDEDSWIRYAAVRGLGALRADAYALMLQSLLNDPEPLVRLQAVKSLDKMRSFDGLRAAASNLDEEVRLLAVQHLQKSPDDFPRHLKTYKEQITDPELSELGQRDMARWNAPPDPRDEVSYGKDALPILISALEDKSEKVSAQAGSVLWSMRRDALPALEALEKIAFNSPHVSTRLQALGALAAIGPEGRSSLERAVNDPEPRVRDYAISTLNFLDYRSKL
jgi:hypothetical protein